MTQASIQAEIDAARARQSRIDALLEKTPPHQMKRYREIQRQGELALARVFGGRLHARVSERIVEGMILDPEVLCSIGGGVNEMPTTTEGWHLWAKRAAAKEPLAALSINHSDAQLREELRRDVLDSIRPEQRISMARAGTLDAFVEGEVKARIEARSGV
jgi:hypothetical protein